LSARKEAEKRKRNPRSPRVRWNVYLLRKRAARLGVVEARDRDEAIKTAIKQFDIPMPDRRRISVRLVSPTC
jgi:hypothetical protein